MMDQASAAQNRPTTALATALVLFATWSFATWFFEGRIETLLRPEAAVDRAIYATVANLLIGIAAAGAVLRFLIRRGHLARGAAGFGSATPSTVRLILALALGFAIYVLQGAPSLRPVRA